MHLKIHSEFPFQKTTIFFKSITILRFDFEMTDELLFVVVIVSYRQGYN